MRRTTFAPRTQFDARNVDIESYTRRGHASVRTNNFILTSIANFSDGVRRSLGYLQSSYSVDADYYDIAVDGVS